MQQTVVNRLPLSKARTQLGAVVERARRKKEYFVIEKNGIPAAGLMDIDEFEDYLELQDPKVKAHIKKSYHEYRAGKGRPIEEFLAELKTKRRKVRSVRRRKA